MTAALLPGHMLAMMDGLSSQDLVETLLPFGARESDIVLLDEDVAEPAQYVRYLDIARRPSRTVGVPLPRAVIEVSGQPVLYVVDNLAGARFDGQQLARLRRALAFRASADYVALAQPGRLTIYPVAPSRQLPQPRLIARGDVEAPTLIPSLAFPALNKERISSTSAAVHKLLYRLLTETTQELIRAQVDHLDAISLVGRALFVRFLLDREVLHEEDIRRLCGTASRDCFSNARHAALMSQRLDELFNGDFLPLSSGGDASWFRRLPDKVFHRLTHILYRATPEGQLHLEWGKKWSDLLFDHIPVGLLSQVYEQHAHRFNAEQARTQSTHYTPHYVADYMVSEVFHGLGPGAARARVLDPAAGGGVFLVTAFRRLAAERWRADERQPDTRTLRQILYEQLTGFDISEPALRLCSLGLYLTAIELDPEPKPPERLKFERPLLGTVLHNVCACNRRHGYIGSLGKDQVGAEHRGRYDVVIGNPPWTAWKRTEEVTDKDIDEQVSLVKETLRPIVHEHLGEEAARRYEMVDKAPDLPFFWRALEWARPGGLIALAMHGRLLFKQGGPRRQARDDLFRAVQITGVLNGAAVRDTDFWPKGVTSSSSKKKMRAPFCLVFAYNQRPVEGAAFTFVSPELEETLNNRGRLRIDGKGAQPVLPSLLLEQPTLLKTLFRGTPLDVGVMDRLRQQARETLGEHWARCRHEKGEGFKVRGSPKVSARMLQGIPELNSESAACAPYIIDAERLPRFQHEEVHRCRKRELYAAPLVIMHAVPPVETGQSKGARLALRDVIYSESFYGFSCAKAADPELLARYLLLLLNSRLLCYFVLLSSSQFGVERDAFQLEDIERLPFRPLEELPERLRHEIRPLSEALDKNPERALERLDDWVESVYGLSRWDREVIRDTLEVGLPFARSRERAQRRPGAEELECFRRRLQEVIQPFLDDHARRLSARVLRGEPSDLWIILQIDSSPVAEQAPMLADVAAVEQLIAQADSLASSQLLVVQPPATLLIGLVAQYRYFTPSRARLLALSLLDDHRDVLLGEAMP